MTDEVKNETEIALNSANDVVSQLIDENEKGSGEQEQEHEQEEEGEEQEQEQEEEQQEQPPLPPRNLSLSQIVKNAAKDAVAVKDYISYATVLEELMEDPARYSDDERQEILESLLEVLEEYDDLVLEIGWDLPIPLLQYVESDYKFEEGLSSSVHIKLVMRIFTVLCEKGNPKELFLKGVEALSNLQVYPEDSNDIQERYADMKFYLAFELMFFSLRRIDVQYPSRFLATAITVLLSFLAANLEHLKILSLGVILRRLFTFARDYETGVDVVELSAKRQYPQSEIEVQQKLLQSFVTWVADFTFQRFSVQWAQRFYYELKTGIAFDENKTANVRPYELHLYTERVTECVERLSQLTYSFDMDVIELLKGIVNKEEEEEEEDQDDHDEDDEDDEKTPTPSSTTPSFSNLSDEGIFLLATQTRFDYRHHKDKDITFSELVKLSLRFYRKSAKSGSSAPLGIQDASLFWGIWLTRNITSEEVRKIPQQDFSAYLQSLMVLSATSVDKESRFIAYSLTAKLLGLHTPAVSFDFIVDTLKYCPFENVKDATVRILKTLSLPRRNSAIPSPALRRASTTIDGLSEGIDSLSISTDAIIPLTKDKVAVIENLIKQTLEEVNETGGIFSEGFAVLLSWINFITVIETDKKFLETTLADCHKLIKSGSDKAKDDKFKEAYRQRQGFLTLSIESVRKRWLD